MLSPTSRVYVDGTDWTWDYVVHFANSVQWSSLDMAFNASVASARPMAAGDGHQLKSEASGSDKDFAGNPMGLLRSKKHRSFGDVLRFSDTA